MEFPKASKTIKIEHPKTINIGDVMIDTLGLSYCSGKDFQSLIFLKLNIFKTLKKALIPLKTENAVKLYLFVIHEPKLTDMIIFRAAIKYELSNRLSKV